MFIVGTSGTTLMDQSTSVVKFSHWHPGIPVKGCVAACGYVFLTPKKFGTSTPCAECLYRSLYDGMTICSCSTTAR